MSRTEQLLSKVPAATAAFWIVKILATTLGEVGGNLLSMDGGLGYLAATGVFASVFLALAATQILAQRFHASLYWAAIVASTTAGILTRPLGAVVGNFLDKPNHGGLALSRPLIVTTLAVLVVIALIAAPQRAGGHGKAVA